MTQQTRPMDREVAETVRPDPIRPEVRQLEVIDTDFHFLPDWETLRRYMPEPFRTAFPRPGANGGEYGADLANDRAGTGQSAFGVARTAEDVLRVIDQIGVDTVIISPGLQRPQGLFNEVAVNAVAMAYNDYVRTEVLPVSDRIRAEIMVCQRDPNLAAAEIRRVAGDERFTSVYTEFGANYESIGSYRHEPIYEACAEFGLAITSHAGTFWQNASPLSYGARTWVELFGISSMSISMAYMGSMIMQGLFDKYPNLKMLVKEGGYFWLPDFMLRCDEMYLDHPGDIEFVERKLEKREKYLNKLPSEYVLENFRFSTQPVCVPAGSKDMAAYMRVCHGEDLFCYSSDWPHQTFDAANWLFDYGDAISDTARRKILSENAKGVFSRL